MDTTDRAARTIRRAVFPIFFASGGCALVYQVVWTRQLSLVFGVSVYAISAVLSAFMAGLALGSFLLGRAADRVQKPVRLYGWLEAGIGLYALVFPLLLALVTKPLFIVAARVFEPASMPLQVARFLIALASLLLPTTLMGGTFPVMSRFFVRTRTRAGRDLSLLYAVNTVGAVAGTIAVGFILLAIFGITTTLIITALVNLALAFTAIMLSRREPPPVNEGDLELGAGPPAQTGHAVESEDETDPALAGSQPSNGIPLQAAAAPTFSRGLLRICLAAILLSGFASLAYEVLWTRVLLFYTHNSTFAFSAMLATFLAGLTLGSWLMGLVLDRVRRHVAWFGGLEIALALSVVVSVQVIRRLPTLIGMALRVFGLESWSTALLYIFAQTALVLFVPAVLLGAIFPLATRLYTTRLGTVGRQVGAVYSANTLGAIFGAFAAGFLMIPMIGVRGSFLLLIALNLLLGLVLLGVEPGQSKGKRMRNAAAVLLLGVLCWIAVPAKIFYRNYEKRFGEVLYYKEEAGDTVMVAQATGKPGTRMLIFSDGRGTAGVPTVMEDRFYGHLPMLIHPEPKEILVICFGVGNTMGAIGRHDVVERIDCAELSPGVVDCARFFRTNHHILDDPRVHLTVEDGRNFLLTSKKKYDIIHLDPPEIHTAGVVNLYTREFYELCRDHLKPGGMLSHWVNVFLLPERETKMLVQTVLEVFPHTTIWQGPRHYSFNFISSDRPLEIDLDEFRRRLTVPVVRNDLAEVRLDDQYDFLSLFLLSEDGARRFAGNEPVVTDDRSRVDFSVPRSVYSGFGFKHPFLAHLDVLTENLSEHDPNERGGRLNLMLLSLERESVAPFMRFGPGERVVESAGREMAAGAAGESMPEAGGETLNAGDDFEAMLEARIEKRRNQYRTLIDHDPDYGVLSSWGVDRY